MITRREAAAKSLEQEAVAQTPVTHRERGAVELIQDGSHDAQPREDDLGTLGLKPHDLTACFSGKLAILLDLALDFGERSPSPG